MNSISDTDLLVSEAWVMVTPKVGYVYDSVLANHTDNESSDHKIYNLETPDRIQEIYRTFLDQGLFLDMHKVLSREVTDQELSLVHSINYIRRVTQLLSPYGQDYTQISLKYPSIYANSWTLTTARLAAGSAIELAQKVAQKSLDSGVAIIRPPGSQAMRNSWHNGCFFNNVAIAAKVLTNQKYRVLVVDTSILDHKNLFNLIEGDKFIHYLQVNKSEVQALHNFESKDSIYLQLYQSRLDQVLKYFQPDVILVSASFDGLKNDPWGKWNLKSETYVKLIQSLKSRNLNLVLILDGGYNARACAQTLADCVKILLH